MALGKEGQFEYAQAPHWMRVLEDKYQRLHAKIINQAARFTHRRTPTITTRLLNDCKRKRAASIAAASTKTERDAVPIESGGGPHSQAQTQEELVRDQEGNLCQIERAETNEPLRSEVELTTQRFGQVDRNQDCKAGQQAGLQANQSSSISSTYNTTKCDVGHRPQTHQENTRPRYVSDSTTFNGDLSYGCSFTNTPQSSGLVTRISSAFPRTRSRLSSANGYAVSFQSPRDVLLNLDESQSQYEQERDNSFVNSEIDTNAHGFDQALRFQQEYENSKQHLEEQQEWVDGLRDRLSKAVVNSNWNDVFEEDEEERSERMSLYCQTERAAGVELEAMARRRRRHLTRPVKTSVSRISHKTSQSCPATFNQQYLVENHLTTSQAQIHSAHATRNGHADTSASVSSKPLPASVAPLTAKGIQEGRMRVFARMSLEARHAVDETLKEMKMEEDNIIDNHNDDPGNINNIVDGVKGFNNDVNNNVNNNKSNYSYSDKFEGGNDNGNDDDYKDDHGSNSSLRNNVSAPTGVDANSGLNDAKPQAGKSVKSSITQRPNNRNNYHQQNGTNDGYSSDDSITSNDGNFTDYATRVSRARDAFPSNSIVTQTQSQTHSHSQTNSLLPTNRRSRNAINCLTSGIPVNKNNNAVGRYRLPQLNQNLPLHPEELQEFPSPHPPLPSIKRANLAFRENTFEITPPDFDIRFREIITCQKGDRDTPPLDVRQQSIQKCQQWLGQHTPTPKR